ncbi:MAG: RNase H family protein, partial [Myxococcota bacterium]
MAAREGTPVEPMSWQRARFKGQEVWAEVVGPGEPKVEGGRVPIRYQARPGAKVYRASVDRVELEAGASPEALDEGVSADAASAKPTAKKGTPGGFGKAGTRTAAQAAMAVEAAGKLVAEIEGRGVLCFTDGSCRGNPGPAGSGACVWLPSGRRGEASRSLGRATNNVAELTAIGLALELLDEEGVAQDHPGAIFTDSAYAHGVLA